jgi:ribonuclease HI
MQLTIHTDGGSRGNPGISGGGMVVLSDSKTFHTASFPFGIKTNNEAEYLAVFEALTWLSDFSQKNAVESVQFFLDSKLVVEQLQQNWKIKEERLRVLAKKCWDIQTTLSFPVRFTHVLRHKNADADTLANQAMDSLQE